MRFCFSSVTLSLGQWQNSVTSDLKAAIRPRATGSGHAAVASPVIHHEAIVGCQRQTCSDPRLGRVQHCCLLPALALPRLNPVKPSVHAQVSGPTDPDARAAQRAVIHVNLAPVKRLTLWSTVDSLVAMIRHPTALTSLSYRLKGARPGASTSADKPGQELDSWPIGLSDCSRIC